MRIMPFKYGSNSLNKSHMTSFKGWHPENQIDAGAITNLVKILETGDVKKVAVSGHVNPDGDSIGSSFAMAYLLSEKTGEPVDIYVFGGLSKKYDFLKDNKNVNVINVEHDTELRGKNYDLAVSVDTATSNLMNQNYFNKIFLKASHTFKLDHHKEDNLSGNLIERTHYAKHSYVDGKAPCASELVMQFVEPLGVKPEDLPKQFNDAVYTGIITDTRNFSVTDNSMVFNDTALLIKNGLNPPAVYKKTFGNVPKSVAEIVMLGQKRVQFSRDKKIAYLFMDDVLNRAIAQLNDKDMEYEANCKLKNMVNELRDIEGVEYAIMFFPRGENKLYVSARSNEKNIRELAQLHGGGGHDKAAGFVVPVVYSQRVTIANVLNEFKKLG